ncbi:MAG: alpha/beta hydrolase family protein [Planctomycetes bacterium]|nr:alpha/beta hydrolase family protein [Planctomycetota bacterium]
MVATRIFMQTFDRFMAWWRPLKKSPRPQAPTTRDFGQYTREEYISHPELFYTRPDGIPQFSNRLVSETEGYKLYKLQSETCYPSGYEQNNKMYLEYYKADKALKSLIILHGWGRTKKDVEKTLCEELAGNGISSVLVTLPYHMERAPEGTWSGEYFLSGNVDRTIEAVRQTIMEIRYIANFLKEQADVIGIYGISLGGVIAHIAMSAEDRFDFGISAFAGGNPAGIVLDGLLTNYVRGDIELAGLSRQELEEAWQIINPGVLPCKVGKNKILMINGKYDQIIPTVYTRQLWEHLDRPQIKWYPCAHYSVYFFISDVFNDVCRFVKEA